MSYRVMIVEDQSMPRQLFEMFVAHSDRYELVASIDDASVADIYCLRQRVDLVLMDVVTRNGESGLDAAARIKRAHPEIRIIIVTSMPEFSYIDKARQIGVDSFWYKEANTEPILSLMDRTMAGESVYPAAPPVLRVGDANSNDFTRRELEVLREMTSGDTNSEIAKRLCISEGTVKTHIANMLLKTGFRNRLELAIHAREIGLVILDRHDSN